MLLNFREWPFCGNQVMVNSGYSLLNSSYLILNSG